MRRTSGSSKDLPTGFPGYFQACVMHDIEQLVIAVRNDYRGHDDFETVINFLDTLYTSNRLNLPLKGILIIGY